MNRYSDYMGEITDIELFERLVGYGLFSERLPGFLTSEPFLAYVQKLQLPLEDKERDYVRYSSMRNINIPRQLAIPEPFAYANLCKILSEHWTEIKEHFKEKTATDKFKISRIHLRKLKNNRRLFKMNYKNPMNDGYPEQKIRIKSRYVAYADISNCFPSIYSHSIPWALVGKTFAKKNRHNDLYFNRIDYYSRRIKYGETNGIPIGPHTSNLISEIILTTIDRELADQDFVYIRNIDDYECYVDSYEEAERFYLALVEGLSKYELVINVEKSKIIPLPQASVKNWVTKLNHFNFTNLYKVRNKDAVKANDLKGFLDFAIELMLNEESDAAVINYAIQIISSKYLGVNAKNYYLEQIHHLVLLYPYLATIMVEYVFDPHNISNKIIGEIANDIYDYGIKNNTYEACSYAIYWALKYGFNITNSNLKKDALASQDCIFMVISYLYDKRFQSKQYLMEYVNHATIIMDNQDFDRYWLYVYEVLPSSKLTSPYQEMKKAKITFVLDEFNTIASPDSE